MFKNLSLGAALLLSLGIINGGVSQALTIDTTKSWDGVEGFYPFGDLKQNKGTATYGQTFTVKSRTTLDNFSLFLDGFDNEDVVDFEGYVMEWDGSKATGDILYQSEQRSSPIMANTGFEEFQFKTGGINLTQGKQYVAFLSASNFFDGEAGRSKMGAVYENPYKGGYFVFFNNGDNFNLLTQNSWDLRNKGNFDAAFKASFSSAQPVPEPVTILGTFVAGALGAVFKRKSA